MTKFTILWRDLRLPDAPMGATHNLPAATFADAVTAVIAALRPRRDVADAAWDTSVDAHTRLAAADLALVTVVTAELMSAGTRR